MRHPLVLAVATLALAACGGGDDAAPAPPADTSAATPDGTTTTTMPVLLPQECSDDPDPSRYVEGEIPLVVPPCEVPSELVVHVLREGYGDPAEDGDNLIVDYTGMIIGSGEVFDTSYTRGQPFDFPLGRGSVIEGWDQGLAGVRAGSLLRLDIPNDLAYGDTPPGDQIQPGDALSFNVEVRAIVPPVSADDAPLALQLDPSVGATEVTSFDLAVGDGPVVEEGDTVVVQLLLIRGDNQVVLFDTWERDNPLRIELEDGQTIPGIFQALPGATVGTRRVITMPPEQAFGATGEPSLGLPAGIDLIAVVDVVGAF